MQLDSVRELKTRLLLSLVQPLANAARPSLAVAARAIAEVQPNPRTLALGIAPGPRGQFRLAIRIQNRALTGSPQLERILKAARGEVELRHVGRVVKRATPWHRRRQRPLRIGASIGHHRVTAGTLGAFVRRRDGTVLVLSNNHVLANENDARRGDPVVQPGHDDGGRRGRDTVASLRAFVRLRVDRANRLDAAVAAVEDGVAIDETRLRGLGELGGLGPDVLDRGDRVGKVGRTTGTTRGRVSAFEIDDLTVEYDLGNLQFNGQIEIESTGDGPFSLGGDSGSLIVDSSRQAVGLLFSGSDQGGRNGLGLTYANPIHAVLQHFNVMLVT